MFQSINDARYTMWATVIPRLDTASTSTGNQPNGTHSGAYQITQDPDTGQITTTWVDGPDSTGKAIQAESQIRCYARGYTALGYRSSANREIYVAGDYNITESIQFDYPNSVKLNNQSLVTNIRSAEDVMDLTSYLWMNEDAGIPTVWEVQGITPVHDPFGKFIRNTTVLKRSEIQ